MSTVLRTILMEELSKVVDDLDLAILGPFAPEDFAAFARDAQISFLAQLAMGSTFAPDDVESMKESVASIARLKAEKLANEIEITPGQQIVAVLNESLGRAIEKYESEGVTA